MLNLEFRFKASKAILVIWISLCLCAEAVARQESQDMGLSREVSLSEVRDWHQFKLKIQEQEKHDQLKGQAYMISGALLVAGGIVGYHNAHNSVEKLAYSVSQSLGVAGIGYGAYLNFVSSEQSSFYQSIDRSRSLTEENKNELVRNYVSNWQENKRAERLTRIATHSLIGALNIYNGFREEQGDLRQGLFVLGGVNLLAAISLSLEF